MDNDLINKTIIVTFDDATRMLDFCKDSDGFVSKDFLSWYIDNEYFCKTGMLIIEGMLEEKERTAVSFDVNYPDNPEFSIYRYQDQSIITNFFFQKEVSGTQDINDSIIDVKYFSLPYYKKQRNLWINAEIKAKIERILQCLAEMQIERRKSGRRPSRDEIILQANYDSCLRQANLISCKQIILYFYAMMYFVSKQEPEEITTMFRKEIDESPKEKIKTIYKYTGYIDLRDNKTYRPIIKKDPNEPLREYQRHIQKWVVRGHYRKTKNGKIWIDSHYKGEGELEKRIYGTEDQKDVNVIPKIFEVERNKPVKQKEIQLPQIDKKAVVEVKETGGKILWNKVVDFLSNLFRK